MCTEHYWNSYKHNFFICIIQDIAFFWTHSEAHVDIIQCLLWSKNIKKYLKCFFFYLKWIQCPSMYKHPFVNNNTFLLFSFQFFLNASISIILLSIIYQFPLSKIKIIIVDNASVIYRIIFRSKAWTTDFFPWLFFMQKAWW